ncbi:MAG: hypothetical protein Q8L37_02915 [Candidatus Gottesmanbacteria bacterium]|nr:hypothetical protein [Candidatus Gottesmanbacteria bacterium]
MAKGDTVTSGSVKFLTEDGVMPDIVVFKACGDACPKIEENSATEGASTKFDMREGSHPTDPSNINAIAAEKGYTYRGLCTSAEHCGTQPPASEGRRMACFTR